MEYLRANFSAVGVDEEHKVIRGVVIAEAGEFKTGRGEFDHQSLLAIVRLINAEPGGVVSNYGHNSDPGTASALDSYLGRVKSARLDGDRVRADLHLAAVAFMSSTNGVSLGERLMAWAAEDPHSLSSSLVLTADKVRNPIPGRPPIWRPREISSSDVVRLGDAVGSLLHATTEESWDAEEWAIRARHRNRMRKLLYQS